MSLFDVIWVGLLCISLAVALLVFELMISLQRDLAARFRKWLERTKRR